MDTAPRPIDLSVYDLLQKIRDRPAIFLDGERSLVRLRSFLVGYTCALGGQNKCLDKFDQFNRFDDWVADRLGYAESTIGWYNMIIRRCNSEEAAYAKFFDLLDDFHDELADKS